MRPGGVPLGKFLDTYIASKGLKEGNPIKKRRASLIPVSPRQDGFIRGRVILVGDAAGLADPILGEGISAAFESGLMAGRAILEGHFKSEQVKNIYETQYLVKTLRELRLARLLAGIVYDFPKIRNVLFRLYGRDFTEALTEIIMGNRAYSQLLSDPLNYIQLLRIWGLGKRKRRAYPNVSEIQ
jgi:flavin-dependent dehydrogenase